MIDMEKLSKMFEFLEQSPKPFGREVASYLRQSGDLALARMFIGRNIGRAVMAASSNEVVMWAIVAAHFEGHPLSAELEVELVSLLHNQLQ